MTQEEHRPDLEQPAPVVMTFVAKFPGTGECGHPIREGDLIGKTTDGGYVCESCLDQ